MTVRHDLLQLTPEGWSWLLKARPDLAGMPAIRRWIERDHPAMRRRRQPGDDADLLPVAVALPLAWGRSRLGFQVPADLVASVRSPPALADALDGLPDPWRQRAWAVLEMAEALAVVPRLFGSAMWHCVTGMAYLRDGSDLDLLWTVPGRGVAVLLDGLARLDALPGPRLDGEVVLSGARAVSWRELAGGADEVLVRTIDAVALMPRAGLLCSC